MNCYQFGCLACSVVLLIGSIQLLSGSDSSDKPPQTPSIHSENKAANHNPVIPVVYNDRQPTLESQVNDLQKQITELKQSTRQNFDRMVDYQTAVFEQAPVRQDATEIDDRDQDQIAPALAERYLIAEQATSETIDKNWSEWAKSKITRSVDQIETKGANLIDSQCYATLCKVQLSTDEITTFDTALNAFSSSIPWKSQGFYYVDESDPNVVVTYISREGL